MLLEILNLIGVIACAVTGALAAGRVKMDWFGVLIISNVTALGGGSVRDILLNNYPLPWVQEPYLLIVVAVCSFLTILIAQFMYYLKTIFLVLDAIGLVAFTLLGAQAALQLGYGVVLACVAGVCTGSFGGVIRDLLCNRIPLAFKAELYASIAFVTTIFYWLMLQAGIGTNLAVIIAVVFGISFRLLAIKFNLSLPVFDYDDARFKHITWLDRGLRKLRRRRRSKRKIDYSDPNQVTFHQDTSVAEQAEEVASAVSEAIQQVAQQVEDGNVTIEVKINTDDEVSK
ncbi:hypothetical protein CKF59_01720 [Psittacicella gerlachiana]|uniref:Glycine transporter domain-containing protein n=1 Tax=Psittacicella gerlachiana TaxID=2028574 RepID=A0A3A1YGU7_9GAMM|nr:hypothetical protein CKF59_01720 [Psittacicella gerlachiana]